MKRLQYPCLVRDFIHDRLYHPEQGYFMKSDHQLGQLTGELRYHDFSGIHSYMEAIGKNYPQYAFLTPVEIFQPWYGHTIANYCLQKHTSPSLKIIELGGGTGTGALSILDFYKQHHVQTYNRINYTLCEISPVLAETAKKRLYNAHPTLVRSGQVNVVNKSAFEFHKNTEDQVFVIALEMMDNLTHDRIWKDNNGEFGLQTIITENLIEVKEPITDEVIRNCLSIYQNMPPPGDSEREAEFAEGFIYNLMKYFLKKKSDNIFLPTGLYMLMKHFCENLKNPHFILADFDILPSTKIKGINAPIVSKKGKKANEKKDYDTYLTPVGEADIFFPTDFRFVQELHRNFRQNSGTVYKSYKFMEKYAKSNWTQTQTGYKPLFDDFRNTSFFTSE